MRLPVCVSGCFDYSEPLGSQPRGSLGPNHGTGIWQRKVHGSECVTEPYGSQPVGCLEPNLGAKTLFQANLDTNFLPRNVHCSIGGGTYSVGTV